MGNICGKESKADPFSQPGRTVGSAPPPQNRSSVPKIAGQGHTLGGSGGGEATDARSAAAKAAEVGDGLAPRFKKYPDAGRLLTML